MRVTRFVKGVAVSLLGVGVLLALYSRSPSITLNNAIATLLVTTEFVVLLRSTNKYVHWLFYKRQSVVKETKEWLLVYTLFLVIGVLAHAVTENRGALLVIAVVLPAVTVLVSVGVEGYRYFRGAHQHS